MKKILLVLFLICFTQAAFASYTKGYFKSNGTYVHGYHKTSPNHTKLDNYSTKGNFNPYTGKTGTVNSYTNYNTNYSNNNSSSHKTNFYNY